MRHEGLGRMGFLITNMSGGGAERVISNLASGLSEHKPELFLFDDEIVYPFDGEIHIIGAPLADQISDLWSMGRALLRLTRIKRSYKLHTCVSFLTWPNFLNILSRSDERVIISVRNHPSLSIRGRTAPFIKMLVRKLYPQADHIVAISEEVRQDLIDNFGIDPSKITTIYNPIRLDTVHTDALKPLPKELQRLREYPTVVSMGRLTLQKGQWHLLRAFSQVKERVTGARLVLLGVGPYQDYLAGLARDLGLSVWVRGQQSSGEALDHDVIFWGFSSNPFPILAASDVFAFTSLWEGLGNVVLESLATGLPVVSADCRSGPREILAPGRIPTTPIDQPEWTRYGVLVPVCDGDLCDSPTPLLREERIWADILTRLLKNEELRRIYSVRGRVRAADFALEKITAHWQVLLGSLDAARK